MTENCQFIPFDIPEYLFTYLASQLNTVINSDDANHIHIEVDRYSFLGKQIHDQLKASESKPLESDANLFLKVSNWSGNNYEMPQGRRHFLMFPESAVVKMIELIKSDFNESLITFVKGAEFAHSVNGWNASQKRKGIRTNAIKEFCLKHHVSFDDKNLESFVKMVQRASKAKKKEVFRIEKKLVQSLSY